jgi:hypothetical protein
MSCSCHSPTLRPWIAAAPLLPRVFVEAFWSPALVSDGKYAGKSSRPIYSFNYRAPAGEDLSLSGGASIQSLVFFKLSITSFVERFAFKRRRRPFRIALASSRYAAARLARATPSEGPVIVGPQQTERLVPARRAGRDVGHGRPRRFDVGVAHLHWSSLRRSDVRGNLRRAQVQFTKSAQLTHANAGICERNRGDAFRRMQRPRVPPSRPSPRARSGSSSRAALRSGRAGGRWGPSPIRRATCSGSGASPPARRSRAAR